MVKTFRQLAKCLKESWIMSHAKSKAKKYKVFIPGNFHYLDFYGKSERDVRNQVRVWLNVGRLPNGTVVEPANPKDGRSLQEANRFRQELHQAGIIEVG